MAEFGADGPLTELPLITPPPPLPDDAPKGWVLSKVYYVALIA